MRTGASPLLNIVIRADKFERFQNDRIELQRMLGRVRAVLELECPSVSVIRITGLVDEDRGLHVAVEAVDIAEVAVGDGETRVGPEQAGEEVVRTVHRQRLVG